MRLIALLALTLACGGEPYEEYVDTTTHDVKTLNNFTGFGTNRNDSTLAAWPASLGCPNGCAYLDGLLPTTGQQNRIIDVCIDGSSQIRDSVPKYATHAASVKLPNGLEYLVLRPRLHTLAAPCKGNLGIEVTNTTVSPQPADGEQLIHKFGKLTFSGCSQITNENAVGTVSNCTRAKIELDTTAINLFAAGHGNWVKNDAQVKQAVFAFMHAAMGHGLRGDVSTYAHNKFSGTVQAIANAFDYQGGNRLRCQALSVPQSCAFNMCFFTYDGNCG